MRLDVRSASCVLVVAGVALLACATRAAAQDQTPPAEAGKPRIEIIFPPPPSRPAVMMPLYFGLAGLQAFDGYATIHGARIGGTEQNPLVGGLANRPVAFVAIKAASTATTIYFAERLWRDHRKTEAIITMVVANVAMGVVAARNAAFLRSQ